MLNSKSNLKPNKTGVGGIKTLIAISSLAITLGGWGILAADQLQSGTTTQTAFVQAPATNQQQQFNPLAGLQVSSAPRPIARTRSSR